MMKFLIGRSMPVNFIIMKDIEKIGGGIQDAEAVELGLKEFANFTRDVGFKIVFGTEEQNLKNYTQKLIMPHGRQKSEDVTRN